MAHKEKRKLIRVGETSFAVILPISWLRYYNLKYGDSVEVISNGIIKIKPEVNGAEGKRLTDNESQTDNVIKLTTKGSN